MSLIKPAMWALTPGLVDPKWGWFHKDVLGAGVIWEGNLFPYDVINKVASGSDTVGGTLLNTSRGMALNLGTSERLDLNSPRLENLILPFTLIFYGILVAATSIIIATQDWDDRSTEYYGAAAQSFSNNNLAIAYGSGTGANSSHRKSLVWIDAVTFGELVLFAGTQTGANTGILYKNGVSLGAPDSTSGTGGAMAQSPTYNGALGSVADETACTYLMWAVLNANPTAAQHFQLSLDPFGPFRMFDEARVVYSLPAAGGAFPPPFSRRLNPLLRM